MLNIATTTLQIKTTGVNMSEIQTLYITIKKGDSIYAKSNSDIEVDGDVISVALTKEETKQLQSGGGIRVTITAVDNSAVSTDVKVVWVKFGSMSSGASSGGGSSGSGETTIISNQAWYPSVSASGEITWVKSSTEEPPTPRNIKGENGTTPHIDATTGNWFIGTVNTGVKAKGTDGATPTIGLNGNWFIDGTDTGVKAKGKDGEPGADGFSPTITENAGNNSETYKLDITTKDNSFTTPNLKGKDGDGASSGGGSSIFGFEIREDGHLWLITDDETKADSFYINDAGHLIYRLE